MGVLRLDAMLVELGDLAAEAMRDPADLFGPFVDLLVKNRDLAREQRRFAEADARARRSRVARDRSPRHAGGIDLGPVLIMSVPPVGRAPIV